MVSEDALLGSSQQLNGKVALVTGAGNGIGAATGRLACARGARVAFVDHDMESARSVVGDLDAEGAIVVGADISQPDQVDAAVRQVVDHFGGVDILINVAGVFDQMEPVEELSIDVWDRVFAINVRGSALMMKRVLQEMLPARAGAIVNTSSTSSFIGGGGGAAYAASKGAVTSLTRQVAYEVADRGVRVNSLAPGRTDTSLLDTSAAILGRAEGGPRSQHFMAKTAASLAVNIPMGRAASPDEMAKAAVFLASDDASYITGATLVVDGGLTIH